MLEQLQADILKASVTENNDISIDVVVHESIDSTNSWSLRQVKAGRVLPFACFAEKQTQGRGRRGKQWLMSSGANIAMSLAWPFAICYEELNLLPLSVAMAIVETLESFGLAQVQVKWPNDVYVQGRKIAGILLETKAMKSGLETSPHAWSGSGAESEARPQIAVVIGVGLNYDMSAYEADNFQPVASPLTDICSEVKLQALEMLPERAGVAKKLLQNIVRICQGYPQCAASDLIRFQQNYDYCKNKYIDLVLDNGSVLSGVAQGVNSCAELLVVIDGQRQGFNSAEVSVRASSNFLSGQSDAAS
ncbi:MAG: biotin--[acetyl-CoA-carboxylase] ligase [Gammaproteobacteria bacterium]|nr:biotin--[acetyl-CoA-carboxylase] ligase [Gammaproteobacteria bacterium]